MFLLVFKSINFKKKIVNLRNANPKFQNNFFNLISEFILRSRNQI